MSDTQTPRLTDKQRAFIDYYVIHKNATKAARLAGYGDDYDTWRSVGSENLAKPNIRAELDRRFAARAMTAEEVIGRLSETAAFDLGEFLDDEGKIKVPELKDAGLGHLVRETVPTREGRKITLADPDAALKLVGRHLGLFADRVDLTIEDRTTPSKDILDSLVQQVAALEQQADSGGDVQDTDDA